MQTVDELDEKLSKSIMNEKTIYLFNSVLEDDMEDLSNTAFLNMPSKEDLRNIIADCIMCSEEDEEATEQISEIEKCIEELKRNESYNIDGMIFTLKPCRMINNVLSNQ